VTRARRWLGREARLLEIIMGETDAARAMQHRAQELLDEAEATVPPFDLGRVASHRGVRTIRRVPMSSDARLIPEADGLAVEVNRTHTRGKQRFSIAHEVAHTLLPGYSGGTVDDYTTGAYALRTKTRPCATLVEQHSCSIRVGCGTTPLMPTQV
jgi:hypothetical protein